MPNSAVTVALKKHLAGPLKGLLRPRETLAIRTAPGRVDILGGLAAEAGATLAQAAVPRRAAVAAQFRDDGLLVLHSADIAAPLGDSQVRLPLTDLLRDGVPLPPRQIAPQLSGPLAWAAPFVALWCVLQQTPGAANLRAGGLTSQPRGLTLAMHSDIPMHAGQAASTAILVAALSAIAEAAAFRLDPLDAALAIHRAENFFAPGSAHVVDALTCLHADGSADAHPSAPHVLRFSAQPYTLVSHVELPHDLRLVALDTGVRYTAASSTVGSLRLAGAMGLRIIETIYRDLGQRHTPLHGYLANVSPSLYRQYFRSLLPRRLRGADFIRTYGELSERAGTVDPRKFYHVRTAVDHLVSEHEHAESFLQTIEDLADPGISRTMTRRERSLTQQRAGRLLLASHHSYRLRLELSCREADWLVDHLMEAGPEHGILGGRITACGGGGTVVALTTRTSAANDALLDTMNAYHKLTGLQLAIADAGTTGLRARA